MKNNTDSLFSIDSFTLKLFGLLKAELPQLKAALPLFIPYFPLPNVCASSYRLHHTFTVKNLLELHQFKKEFQLEEPQQICILGIVATHSEGEGGRVSIACQPQDGRQ